MTENACRLDGEQRKAVELQVAETCDYRNWTLHEVNCRTNHIHVVVTAATCKPKVVRSQIKAWCTRRLKELDAQRRPHLPETKRRSQWWAERGSQRCINDEDSLEAAILYVRDGQDRPR